MRKLLLGLIIAGGLFMASFGSTETTLSDDNIRVVKTENTIAIDGVIYYTNIDDVAPCDDRGGWCSTYKYINGYYRSDGTYVQGHYKTVWHCCY